MPESYFTRNICFARAEQLCQKLFKKKFRLDVRKFTFSNRVVNDWNSLSSQCVNPAEQWILLKHLSSELEPETAK